jgi:predicted nucleotidyltransferase
MKIGIIQSRGLGDLIIALPIAQRYREQGYEVFWPICEEFMPSMTRAAPWVNWIPLKTDQHGNFFYFHAYGNLKYRELDEIVCLYQYLSNMPELSDPTLFPICKFDQYKYAKVGMALKDKLRLPECITRDPAAERELKERVVTRDRYIVVHLEGSSARVDLDFSDIDPAVQIVEIREGFTDNVFDWLGVLEGAEAMYMIDSCFSNMVDAYDLCRDKWFIQRSKMDLTPVLLSDWQYFPRG